MSIMNPIITATFVKTRMQDSGSENTLDYLVFEFANIKDHQGNLFGDKWIKTTKLLQQASLTRGKTYQIILSDSISEKAKNMQYPIEISDGTTTYLKKGGSIRKLDKSGKETNLSMPNGYKIQPGMTALDKLSRDKMTEEDLLKQNKKGIYFSIHLDIKKQTRIGFSSPDKGNYILIERTTQKEIDEAIENTKQRYSDLIKHFKINHTRL